MMDKEIRKAWSVLTSPFLLLGTLPAEPFCSDDGPPKTKKKKKKNHRIVVLTEPASFPQIQTKASGITIPEPV